MHFPNDMIVKTPSARNANGLNVRPLFPSSMLGTFGMLITAQEHSVIHLQFPYGLNSELVIASGVLGGAVTASNGMAICSVGTDPASAASIESISACRYIAGQGVRMKFAGIFSPGVSSSFQEIGIGDDTDGFFFGYSGSFFGVNRRRDGINDWTFSGSWNYDSLDGRGNSEFRLNPLLGNIYSIGYQWLGFGAINFSVEDSLTGEFVPVHQIRYSNSSSLPSVFNPTLPLRMNVRNWGNTVPIAVSASSLGVFTEGLPSDDGVRRSTNLLKTVTTEAAVFSLQNKTSLNGRKNRTRSKLDFISLSDRAGTGNVEVRLVLNPTLGGSPSFSDLSSSVSPMARDVAGTTVTGGRELFTFEVGGNGTLAYDLSRHNFKINPGEIIAFTASGSVSSAVSVAVSWKEEV